MAIRLTETQLKILINALHNRINEIDSIINPLLIELEEHKAFLVKHEVGRQHKVNEGGITQNFEILPWSKKISQVLFESGSYMTTHEIVGEIVNRIPALANESSTRSSVASILSRRSGKLFKKSGDRYGLIEWKHNN